MSKSYEFTFTVESKGDTVDEAFASLKERLESSLAPLFIGFVDYEELTAEEQTLITYAEEVFLESQKIAEA